MGVIIEIVGSLVLIGFLLYGVYAFCKQFLSNKGE